MAYVKTYGIHCFYCRWSLSTIRKTVPAISSTIKRVVFLSCSVICHFLSDATITRAWALFATVAVAPPSLVKRVRQPCSWLRSVQSLLCHFTWRVYRLALSSDWLMLLKHGRNNAAANTDAFSSTRFTWMTWCNPSRLRFLMCVRLNLTCLCLLCAPCREHGQVDTHEQSPELPGASSASGDLLPVYGRDVHDLHRFWVLHADQSCKEPRRRASKLSG